MLMSTRCKRKDKVTSRFSKSAAIEVELHHIPGSAG